MYINKNNFKEKVAELLKDKVYMLNCDNYCDNNQYWLKNGILYKWTGFNFEYDKAYNKISHTKLAKDGMYIASLIDSKHNRLMNINN